MQGNKHRRRPTTPISSPSSPIRPGHHVLSQASSSLDNMAQSTAHRRLLQEYRALTNSPPEGITAGPVSEDDLLHWECLIQGPEGTPFEGGVFPAELRFPKDYPLAPPTMKFLADMWHPNVYPSGLVCISILHPPGDDPNHYEHASERWSPIQSVEKILISVMSMLAEPNDESPANVEAAKMWRERRAEYENKVRDGVRRMLGL
ncbi:ubiquitin-conjugating enzyme [Metarhizium rileyi]|uniref:Ubiquitin-conjugating enzyme E2 2 n=2 Tax=Metarhizium rileyi (strain RCEF 4871) TaxID=1649241 RepID=A0A167CXD0_METRR|nr:ubiquitin-conjugating enzyme [Metarhizium rileyi RCEF 4871]